MPGAGAVHPIKTLDNQAHRVARANKDARLLTTAPGVGSIVALIYASAIDDPARFKSSKRGTAIRPDPRTIPVRREGRNWADIEGW